MEENYTYTPAEATSAKPLCKTWCFTEENNKHTTYHTFTIQGKRFSHQAELKEAAQSYRQRTDFNLDNVYAVNSYYGITRNLVGTMILAILAALSLIGSIMTFANGGSEEYHYDYKTMQYITEQTNDHLPLAIGLLVVAAIFGVLAYFLYKKITPSFILEIQTVIPKGQLDTQSFTYGTPSINFGKKTMNPLLAIVLVVLWPIGIIYLLTHAKGNKYKFKMDEQTGLDIVDTIGAHLIKE